MKFLFLVLIFSPILVQAKIQLSLNWKAEPQFGGFYEALIKNYFKNKNLDVEIIEGGSGTPTVQLTTAGKTDYAIVSGDEILLSHDRGAKDIVALFASYQTIPVGIMTHAEKNYKTLQDLLADSSATLLWREGLPYAQFIKKNTQVKAQTAPYLGGISNFQHDASISQQCFLTSEPLLAEKAGLKIKTFSVAESGYNPYVTVLVTKASRAKASPAEVKAFVQAVREGWQSYLKSPSEANKYMANLNKAMDLKTFTDSAKAQERLINTPGTPLGSMTQKRWQTLADQLLELKLIKSKLDAKETFLNL